MAKINKEEQARREGMSYALRLAKEKGLEALEEDLKLRMATDLPITCSKKALDDFSQKVKNRTLDCVLILMMVTLHDECGFGAKRLQKVMDRFNLKTDCLADDYTTWTEQIEILRDECGIELSIRDYE